MATSRDLCRLFLNGVGTIKSKGVVREKSDIKTDLANKQKNAKNKNVLKGIKDVS